MRKLIFFVLIAAVALATSNWVGPAARADGVPAVRHKRVPQACTGLRCGPYAPCGARCRVSCPDGEQTIRADFVVAGDGMHSVVRESVGIGFDGDSYADSFVLADVSMNWRTDRDEVAFYL